MKQSRRGFTLLELVVVLAILAMLWGLMFAVLAPAREKGRQAVCISNLRQIYQAMEIYRRDWGGSDWDSGATEYWQLGLPPNPYIHVNRQVHWLIGTEEIWHCPDSRRQREILPPGALPFPRIDYGYAIPTANALKMKKALTVRGEEYPIVFDDNHNPPIRQETRLVIVLRLNGQVQTRPVPFRAPSEEW